MEDQIAGHSPAQTIAGVAAPVAWRDLREWLDLVEANDLLKHIASRVEPDEELAAITLLAPPREDAPASARMLAFCATCSAPARSATPLPPGSIRIFRSPT